MKRIFIATAIAVTACLSSCGGKSEASREQINNGYEEAKEMLDKAHAKTPAATPAEPTDTANS